MYISYLVAGADPQVVVDWHQPVPHHEDHQREAEDENAVLETYAVFFCRIGNI